MYSKWFLDALGDRMIIDCGPQQNGDHFFKANKYFIENAVFQLNGRGFTVISSKTEKNDIIFKVRRVSKIFS